MEDIGSRLQHLRSQKGISILQASDFLGVSEDEIKAIERGRRHPTRQQVIGFASYFEEDVNDLLIAALQQRLRDDFSQQATGNMRREYLQLVDGNLLIKIHKPAFPLSLYIESIVYYRGHSFGFPYETTTPDGFAQLGVRVGSGAAENNPVSRQAWIVGVQQRPFTRKVSNEQDLVIVRFFPGALYALTQVAQEGMPGFITADALFGSEISGLCEDITGRLDLGEIFSRVERFLVARLAPKESEYSLIRHISERIFTPFTLLVKESGYSQKHLIALFKKHIGVTPKVFYRIRRYAAALNDMIGNMGRIEWAAFARDHLYFDQAHLIKEFSQFTGYSPQRLRDTGVSCPLMIRTLLPA